MKGRPHTIIIVEHIAVEPELRTRHHALTYIKTRRGMRMKVGGDKGREVEVEEGVDRNRTGGMQAGINALCFCSAHP